MNLMCILASKSVFNYLYVLFQDKHPGKTLVYCVLRYLCQLIIISYHQYALADDVFQSVSA
jgi:hypothetical protein